MATQGNHFFPEVITVSESTPTGPEYRTWNRLLLADAVSSIDVNGIMTSMTEDVTGTTVEVDAGTTTNLADLAATWFFPLQDDAGNPLTGTQYFDIKLYIEIVTPPTTDSNVWVSAGVFSDATANAGMYGGIVFNSASGNRVRASNSSANSDSSVSASTIHMICEGTLMGASLRNMTSAALDSSKVATGIVSSRGGSITLGAAPVVGVTVGRTATSGTTETIKFNAYILSMMPSEVLP